MSKMGAALGRIVDGVLDMAIDRLGCLVEESTEVEYPLEPMAPVVHRYEMLDLVETRGEPRMHRVAAIATFRDGSMWCSCHALSEQSAYWGE